MRPRSSPTGTRSRWCSSWEADSARRGGGEAAGDPARAGGRVMVDELVIGTHRFSSRLFVGTGKYKDLAETRAALEASGAEVVTVAVRRVELKERGRESLI